MNNKSINEVLSTLNAISSNIIGLFSSVFVFNIRAQIKKLIFASQTNKKLERYAKFVFMFSNRKQQKKLPVVHNLEYNHKNWVVVENNSIE